MSDYSIDPEFFTTDCYTGFGDDEDGFYAVYSKLIDQIIEQESPHLNAKDCFEYPRFGDSHTELDSVKQFYDVWQGFTTSIPFVHLNKYDIREAPNRKVVRLMEKENKKIRDEAKKERNSEVQV